MGKPLSRPDCLRQNPPCVGKGEEEEDLNIEDCYVPQRSIYDTVRLNEQIDSGSKGSLSSRHFTDRTLPYSHRTLDVSSLCSNGALTSSSVFELRGREANKLDEKMIFDALKLNSDIIRTTGLPKAKSHAEKKEHRRSWRMFVPANFMDYANKSESSFVEPTDVADAVTKASKYRWGTNSLTSEEDDSGLCSPPAEREDKQGILTGDQSRIRSLSSAEDIHIAEQYRPFFSVNSISEQKIPLLSYRSAHPDENFKMILRDASPLEEAKRVIGQRKLHGENSCLQDDLKESTGECDPLIMLRDGENEHIFEPGEEKSYGPGESKITVQNRQLENDSPQDLGLCHTDLGKNDVDYGSTSLIENVTLTLYDSEESNIASKEEVEAPLSAQDMEVIHRKYSPKFIPVRKKAAPKKTRAQAEILDTVFNDFQSVQLFTWK
ncbi:uncharacterized protein LOC126082320 [Elephas maximus indicus]|uniref:uncharacterized protein LOC126082320 n=1 Tax=Elephas maximus indicus TaxID=99487 RepID=UPI002115F7DC|nr:uncharacterized protein LOC126082320 [Elephas maximus indicus]